MSKLQHLFSSKLDVINVGLQLFNDTLKQQDVSSTHLQWKPAAHGDAELIKLLEIWKDDPRVVEANQLAVSKMMNAQPIWKDIVIAKEAVNLDKYTLLHAGPPIRFDDMSGPMVGAIMAALKYEGLASNDEEAMTLARSGKITFDSCHHYGCVGPMTGIISASMPLIEVVNETDGNKAYSTINEGAGDVARFGAHSENTVARLKWIETVLAPVLKEAILHLGGMNLKVLIAQALTMGDELHMRNNASTPLFIKNLIYGVASSAQSLEQLNKIVAFLTTNNDQFFLNFAMAAAKASADAARNIPFSTMVVAMARNGVKIGIQVSGISEKWFEAPAAEVKGLYFPGYSEADANKDIGDSAIMETLGVGGFAMAAGSAIVKFVGAGSYEDAVGYTTSMYDITLAKNNMYVIPNLDFMGVPTGIDLLKVVETTTLPAINTAIASKLPGVGMIGAGVSLAPFEMFADALRAFEK